MGRDASPVLERYPPKDPALSPRGPTAPAARPAAAAAPPAPAPAPGSAPAPAGGAPLIRLERPFDVDDFSAMLGETTIEVTVPRENLGPVLERVATFMGFGIYVYAISVHPSPSDMLRSFTVRLQRVDYSAAQQAWVPFVEKGTSDSPFGPSGTRT